MGKIIFILPDTDDCDTFYRSPRGHHRHRCSNCGYIWEHGDYCIGKTEPHTCTQCGEEEWVRYFGPEEPSPTKESKINFKKITLAKVFSLIAAIIGIAISIHYSWLIATARIQPVIATWILFCVAVTASFLTYRASSRQSIVGNIANSIDLVVVWMILFTITFFGRNSNFTFNLFEIICLCISFLILVFWKLSRRHVVSNLLLQGVLTIAYFPLIYHLVGVQHNTESFSYWGFSLLGASCALTSGILMKNKLGTIYSLRAFILVLIVLILMIRIVY